MLRQADSIQLRWPREPAGFILESAAAVDAPPEAWQTVPGEPVVDGGFNTLNVSPLLEARFFRLRK